MDLKVITMDGIKVALASSFVDKTPPISESSELMKSLRGFYNSLLSNDCEKILSDQKENISISSHNISNNRSPDNTNEKLIAECQTFSPDPAIPVKINSVSQNETDLSSETKLVKNETPVIESSVQASSSIVESQEKEQDKVSKIDSKTGTDTSTKQYRSQVSESSPANQSQKLVNDPIKNSTLLKAQKCLEGHNFSEEENGDIMNPDWVYLKNLKNDAARYKAVRAAWGSTDVPDPNVNLSLFNYCKTNKNADLEMPQNSRKRKPLTQLHPYQHPKRRKNFTNVSFYERTIREMRDHVFQLYRRQYNNTVKKSSINHIEKRYGEKIAQLDSLHNEVTSLLNFYRGLPNQKQHMQEQVEEEQYFIEKVYESFGNHYRWSQTEFHVD